jgi:cob(I)alamin adenosyltransferase
MASISTKTGDKGTTALANGQRLPKSDLVFEVLGDLDELSSHLGLILAQKSQVELKELDFLKTIQHDLYLISAQLVKAKKVKLKKSSLTKLEKEAQSLQKQMEEGWHSKFLYPGGTEIGAQLDISRAVCRRAERHLFKFAQDFRTVSSQNLETVLKYTNRLSDYLYLLRCYVNQESDFTEQELKAV